MGYRVGTGNGVMGDCFTGFYTVLPCFTVYYHWFYHCFTTGFTGFLTNPHCRVPYWFNGPFSNNKERSLYLNVGHGFTIFSINRVPIAGYLLVLLVYIRNVPYYLRIQACKIVLS